MFGGWAMGAARDRLFPAVFARTGPGGTPVVGLVASSVLVTLLIAMNYTKSLVDCAQGSCTCARHRLTAECRRTTAGPTHGSAGLQRELARVPGRDLDDLVPEADLDGGAGRRAHPHPGAVGQDM